MSDVYNRHGVRVLHGDCLDVLAELDDASVDAIVTDPPYGLGDHKPADVVAAVTAWASGDRDRVPAGRGFMGAEWDAFVPPPAVWDECLRVLKPGGHMLVFAGSRTVDLMGLSIRLAGFEIRDTLQWLYSQGFPKSLDVSKSLDKLAGAERGSDGYVPNLRNDVYGSGMGGGRKTHRATPATDAARQWEGWGTALKPAAEPIILARKPLASTVARNVLAHGVGGLNIDGCRVAAYDSQLAEKYASVRNAPPRDNAVYGVDRRPRSEGALEPHVGGRFPANVLLTHNPECADTCDEGCPVAELDAQSGVLSSWMARTNYTVPSSNEIYGKYTAQPVGPQNQYGDSGGASRFFPTFRWEAKAPTSERPQVDGISHPTTKPVALMRWLVRLITPPKVPCWYCVTCDNANGDVQRVRTDVPATASRADGVLGRVSTEAGGASQEASAGALPDVREGVDGANPEVLLGDVPGGGEPQNAAAVPRVRNGVHRPDGSEDVLEGVREPQDAATGAPVSAVRAGVPTTERSDLLQPGVRGEGDGSGEAQGHRPDDGGGVSAAVRAGAPDGESERLPAGAPQGDGGAAGADADHRRGCAPHQRGEDGQPIGEPGCAGEGGSRPDSEAAAEADRVPSLPRADQGVRACAECAGHLARGERPGLVLDPFAGTGTTGHAARAEGMRALLVERHTPYLPLIVARLDARDRTPAAATGQPPPASAEPMDLLDLLDEDAS